MVKDKLWEARTKWKNLGLVLGIHPTSMDAIAARCHHDPDHCFSEVLQQWLEGHGDTSRTWSTITTALRRPSVSMGAIADDIHF